MKENSQDCLVTGSQYKLHFNNNNKKKKMKKKEEEEMIRAVDLRTCHADQHSVTRGIEFQTNHLCFRCFSKGRVK